ncbi:MAG TPA: sugar ABC transporter ATP-binding protein [Rectinemataceae bacterium]|nr:sugar ABC transporter ATP-binding protein [Rectinemataceae bacterium]
MGNEDILTTKGINKSFGDSRVLKNIDFSIRKGEIHGLMGENGAGKSTLIKIISGDYSLDDGCIMFDGKDVKISSPKIAMGLGIRVIYQEINVVKPISVAENIFLGNYPLKKNGMIDWGTLNSDAQAVLDSLGVAIPIKTKVSNLTIAEQQVIEIAKALSVRAKILIMDEPTSALNDQETSKLFVLLRKLRDSGVSIIYITHRFSEMYELTDRITVMRDGEIVDTMMTSDITNEKLIKMMIGKDKTSMFVHRGNVGEKVLFSVKNLSVKGFVEDVSFDVKEGELVVIFGLFGAGQNEVFRAIFGDIRKDTGEIYIMNERVQLRTIKDACDHGIGFVSDDRKNDAIVPLRSVEENICLTALPSKLSSRWGFVRRKQEKALAMKYFSELELRCSGIDQKIGTLSGGNQQKCIIARWLANDAKVLLLNMPTRGVDVGARSEIYRVLEDLSRRGVAIVIISLEMPEVLSIADHIYVMHEKRIVGELSREEATQEKLLSYALGIVS